VTVATAVPSKVAEAEFPRTIHPHRRETAMGSVMDAIPLLVEIMLPVAVLIALFLHPG
jgi:hypothetical protein